MGAVLDLFFRLSGRLCRWASPPSFANLLSGLPQKRVVFDTEASTMQGVSAPALVDTHGVLLSALLDSFEDKSAVRGSTRRWCCGTPDLVTDRRAAASSRCRSTAAALQPE